mgnify:CR=1 FL=1
MIFSIDEKYGIGNLEHTNSSQSNFWAEGANAADVNKDGKMDFVALISQQYEHVLAYINRGPGKGFRAETIFRAVVLAEVLAL